MPRRKQPPPPADPPTAAAGPVVRLTRVETTFSLPPRRRRANPAPERSHHVVYGCDAAGRERVYVEHESEEEHRAWCATDPLWREVQRAIIHRLCQTPAGRRWAGAINFRAAMEAGNYDTAAKIAALVFPEEVVRVAAEKKLAADASTASDGDHRG